MSEQRSDRTVRIKRLEDKGSKDDLAQRKLIERRQTRRGAPSGPGGYTSAERNLAMMRIASISAALLVVVQPALGQDDLLRIAANMPVIEGTFRTYHPPGEQAHAQEVHDLLEDALSYIEQAYDLALPVDAVLMGPEDWQRFLGEHGESAPYSNFLPFVAIGPPHVMALPSSTGHRLDSLITAVSRRSEQVLALDLPIEYLVWRFTALVGIHELGHVFQREYDLCASTHWFSEFLANYVTYAVLRNGRGADAAIWQLVSEAFVEHLQPQQRTLDAISGGGLETYVWFQGSLQLRVHEVYEQIGADFLDEWKRHCSETEEAPAAADLVNALETIAPGFHAWIDRLHAADD